ncbi:MAG: polysaccharide pyruvyl transferase family protein [Planctomycetia bacterium]
MTAALHPKLEPPDAASLRTFWDAQQLFLTEQLRAAVPASSKVALVDYPVHGNTGDHLILLGTEQWALSQKLHIVGRWHIDNFLFRPLPKDTIILCQGGGNFGDLYRFQGFRERVVAAYPHNRIVMLPQTIHFRSKANLEQSASRLRRHHDIHLFVRDHRSFETASRWFSGCRPTLVPDMAAFLHPIPETLRCTLPATPRRNELRFFRKDRERTQIPKENDGSAIDWDDLSRWHVPYILGAVAAGFLFGRVIPAGYASRHWMTFCRNRSIRAARELADHRLVRTNRMHCHILACLLGVPNVVHDNSYGKCSSYYAAWHSTLRFTRFSPNAEGSQAIASESLATYVPANPATL